MVELTFKKSTDPTIKDLLLLLSKQQSVSVHATPPPDFSTLWWESICFDSSKYFP